MRLFKSSSQRRNASRSNVATAPQPQDVEPMDSIGSELAASDQFEIVVLRKKKQISKTFSGDSKTNDHLPASSASRHKSGSILSYFSSNDNDDSTVSSITEGDHRSGGAFYRFNKTYYHQGGTSSIASWCCCSGASDVGTQPTYRSGTENTLLARDSIYGTLQPADSRSQFYRSRSFSEGMNAKCCGPMPSPTPPAVTKRPMLLYRRGGWGRSRGSKVPSEMSASLFDNLSEDDADEENNNDRYAVGPSNSYTGNHNHRNQSSSSRKMSKPLRRALTWKRK